MFSPSMRASLAEYSVYIPFLARGLAMIILIFIVPIEFIVRKSLNSLEDNLITSIQDLRSSGLDDLMKIIPYTSNELAFLVLIPILYNCIDTITAAKMTIIGCHIFYIQSFVSIIFTEPRPYWLNSSIVGVNCKDGYGLPSTEVLFAIVFYLFFVIEILNKLNRNKKIYLMIVIFLYTSFLSFSLMYLGDNFLHQIVITISIGYVMLTFLLSLDPYLTKLSKISYYYSDTNRKMKIYWFIASMSTFFAALTIFINISDNLSIDIKWVKNAYKRCNFSNDISGAYSLYQAGWVFYNSGAVFGSMLVSSKISYGWQITRTFKRLLRSALAVGVSVGIFIGFNAIDTYDEPTEFMFCYAIPAFLCGYFTFGAMPMLFEKLKLNSSSEKSRKTYDPGVSLSNIPI